MGAHRAEPDQPTRSRRGPSGQRGDIQGLRGLAVLAVVLYHAVTFGFGGGFVGVDCFFVISGYLITGLLLHDLRRTGRIDFPGFYGRRARRVLPAAMLVIAATAFAASAWLPPLRARSVLGDGVASALFSGNYRFAVLGTDYLNADVTPSPFQHLWSLGVEEQFYLIWPMLIGSAALACRARPVPRRPRFIRAYLAVAITATVLVSFAVNLAWTRTKPPWAFFSLPSRAWELGAGGLVALAAPLLDRLPGRVGALVGWCGLSGLAWSICRLDAHSTFPGTAALLPVVGSALILSTGGRVGGPALLLDRALVRYLGGISYSWYLWHWPVLILFPAVLGHPAGWLLRISLVAGSAGLAALTTTLVENPIRFASPLQRPRPALAMGAALVALTTVAVNGFAGAVPAVGGSGLAVAPIDLNSLGPSRANGPARALTSGPGKSAAPRTASPDAIADARLAPILVQATADRPVPRNLTPAFSDAADDKAPPFVDGCNLTWTATAQPACSYTSGDRRIVIFGDSHAAQWFPPLRDMAVASHWALDSFTKTTCPPLQIAVFSPYLNRSYTECTTWRRHMMDRIAAEQPALVVLGVARHYATSYGFTVYSPTWLNGLAATVRTFEARGIPVLVMGPTPKPPSDEPTCLSAHLNDVSACDFPRASGTDAGGTAAERRVVEAAGGHYLDIAPWLCTPATCAAVVGNLLVYRDDNHLTTAFTNWLRPLLQDAAEPAMAGH